MCDAACWLPRELYPPGNHWVLTFRRDCIGPSLADDVRGSWSLHHDKFKNRVTLRSLSYPGYTFYYDGAAQTFGGVYFGSGLKNTDLVFML